MSFRHWLAAAVATGSYIERRRPERKRPWKGFRGPITEADFAEMVKKAGTGVFGLKELTCKGPVVYGTAVSKKRGEWHFTIDFNDDGKLTGRNTQTTENQESIIPIQIGVEISSAIRKFRPGG